MKRIAYIAVLALIMVVGVVTSCTKSDDNATPSSGLDRQPMLTSYADNYVIPAYADMLEKLQELKAAIESFNANSTQQQLQSASNIWRNAYATWQKVDLLEFGPAFDNSLRSFVNTYPVTVSKLEANITSGSYDLEAFGNKDAQGFPALDYLLNGTSLDKYTNDANAAARKQYLLAVVDKMVEKVTAVSNEWGTYRNTFVNSTGTDVNSSLSIMVNNFVLYYERYLRGGKIGLPVGAMTGVAKPELVEAYYSQELSKNLLYAALASVQSFYGGYGYDGIQRGESMKSYLAAIGTKDENGVLIADLIDTELEQALKAVTNIGTPIADAVQNDRPTVLTAYEEIQDVVALLKVDMVSAFSISITYTDNDGD